MLGRFDYERPTSLDGAVRCLAEGRDGAAILAGGTDLFVDLRGGRRQVRFLIDVKRVDELRRLDVDRSGGIAIGAAATLNEILERASVRRTLPGLAQAAESIATYQLRNRATAAGNLCNASPAADMAPILLALDATIVARSPRGERTMAVSDFFTGVKRTALRTDEMVVEIRVPAPEPDLRSGFLKQQRLRGHDLAIVSAAASYSPSSGALRVALGSCAATPLLLAPLETKGLSAAAAAEAMAQTALATARPISDVRASAAYRRDVLQVLVRRLVDGVLTGGAP